MIPKYLQGISIEFFVVLNKQGPFVSIYG